MSGARLLLHGCSSTLDHTGPHYITLGHTSLHYTTLSPHYCMPGPRARGWLVYYVWPLLTNQPRLFDSPPIPVILFLSPPLFNPAVEKGSMSDLFQIFTTYQAAHSPLTTRHLPGYSGCIQTKSSYGFGHSNKLDAPTWTFLCHREVQPH